MEIKEYNSSQLLPDKVICDFLMKIIDEDLPQATSKLWHGAPVWFLEDNPVVGYSKQKAGVKLMFWSGADFGDEKLVIGSGKFKDASITYNSLEEIKENDLISWLKKSKQIQWDYRNIVKRKGVLVKI